jgi:hypothetical protein
MMIVTNLIHTDWSFGMEIKTKEKKQDAVKARKCLCCKRAKEVQGNRGRCEACYGVFTRDRNKLRTKAARAEYEQQQIEAGLIRPASPGGRPRKQVPGRLNAARPA